MDVISFMKFLSHVMIRYFVLESWMPDSIQSGKRPNCTRSFIDVLKIFQRLEILKTNLPYKAQRKERYNTVYPWVCVNHLCLNMYAEYLLEVIFLEYFSLDTWIFIDNLKLIPSCRRKDGKIFSATLPHPSCFRNKNLTFQQRSCCAKDMHLASFMCICSNFTSIWVSGTTKSYFVLVVHVQIEICLGIAAEVLSTSCQHWICSNLS